MGPAQSSNEGDMSRKLIVAIATAVLIAAEASATYLVVMKDGTKYRARDKWTVVNGKALLTLENGTTLQLDPSLIDVAKTNAQNQSGLGDATLIGVSQTQSTEPKKPQLSSLGELTKQRKIGGPGQDDAATGAPATAGGGMLSSDVLARFNAAYENVGLYGSKIEATPGNGIRADVTTDNEDQVFKAISATAYLMTQLPAKANVNISSVDLTMTTINRGLAGHFIITPADAKAIDSRQISLQQYFVSRVIF